MSHIEIDTFRRSGFVRVCAPCVTVALALESRKEKKKDVVESFFQTKEPLRPEMS